VWWWRLRRIGWAVGCSTSLSVSIKWQTALKDSYEGHLLTSVGPELLLQQEGLEYAWWKAQMRRDCWICAEGDVSYEQKEGVLIGLC
jgi:hypothetical protein